MITDEQHAAAAHPDREVGFKYLRTIADDSIAECLECGLEVLMIDSDPPHYREIVVASREEQNARYIDCGPLAWDDR